MKSKSASGKIDVVDLAHTGWLLLALTIGVGLTGITDNLGRILIDLNLDQYNSVLIPIWAGIVDLTTRWLKDNEPKEN